jgi:ADP-ribose pyrophosphatase
MNQGHVMTEPSSRARARYFSLRRERPEWFANHPGGFEILFGEQEMTAAEDIAWTRLQAARDRGEISGSIDRTWVTVGVIAEDAWGVIIRDAVRDPAGGLGVYRREMSAPDRPEGVAALTMVGDKVLLLKHYRHALRRFSMECPRGYAQPGESHEETLRRELAEEIQATVSGIRHMGSVDPDGGKLGDSVHLLAANLERTGAPEREEAIAAIELVDIEELRRRVRDNEITDAFTLAAIGKAMCAGLL